MLCSDQVLAHYEPSLKIDMSCKASEVRLGVVFFPRYEDGTRKQGSDQNSASVQLNIKGATLNHLSDHQVSPVFLREKFHRGDRSKALTCVFEPGKATPAIAANRLSRWALTPSQYRYTIEYRKTWRYGNMGFYKTMLTRPDVRFDGEEEGDDINTICTVNRCGTAQPSSPKAVSC